MVSIQGTKIYYCLITGNIIKLILDKEGFFNETTFDEDYAIYTELKERDRTSIGLIEFAYGEYFKLSQNSTGVMVNLETKKLEFTYEPLPPIPQEPTELEIVQSKISILETGLSNTEYILMMGGLA